MGRLLDEDTVIKVLERWQKAFRENSHYVSASDLSLVVKDVRELPPAQLERKKGRWLPDNRPDGGFWVCSECKFPSEAFSANVLYKFCPNCGSDMMR